VLSSDGQTPLATITGRDPQTDLAVLHVLPSDELMVIALGLSASVKVAERHASAVQRGESRHSLNWRAISRARSAAARASFAIWWHWSARAGCQTAR
jgi:S1-C subfamily serine protease